MPLLKIDKINAFYQTVRILREVSFEIETGEIVSLLGGNGAGKTTTVKTISGLVQVKGGAILFADRDISTIPAHKRVEIGLVQVPEGRKVFPSLSVLENLELGAYLPVPKQNRPDSLERVLAMFPILKERSHQAAGTLSGGEQQMLALGRGLMSLPKLLILDEPSLGLAPIIVEDIFESVVSINKENVTILLVEQNVPQALGISNRAYVLEEGRIVISGQGSDLLNDDRIRRVYLGMEAT